MSKENNSSNNIPPTTTASESDDVATAATTTATPTDHLFFMGDGIHTFQISVRDLFVTNRQKVIDHVVQNYYDEKQQPSTMSSNNSSCNSGGTNIVLYIMGGTTQLRYDTDHEPIFRQESYFFYLTGINEPDCAISIHIHLLPPSTTSRTSSINEPEDAAIPTTNDTTTTTTTSKNSYKHKYSYTSTTRLYIPNLPSEYATVMGPIRSQQEWKDMYLFDSVEYMTTLVNNSEENHRDDISTTTTPSITPTVVEQFLISDLLYVPHDESNKTDTTTNHHHYYKKILMVMNGINSDSGNVYPIPNTLNYSLFQNNFGGNTTAGIRDGTTTTSSSTTNSTVTIDTTTLYPIIAECRVIKSDIELYLLRYVTEVTSFGHAYVMRNFHDQKNNSSNNNNSSSSTMYEYQGESLFRHYCYYNYGCRLVGYTPICGCGPNSAILHYGHSGRPNADPVTTLNQNNNNTICLFDMGIEYYHYGSDVTCSFPSNGIFTLKQRQIYEAVLNAQIVVYNMMQPGVSWVDCHKAAEATILQALVDIGIVRLSPTVTSMDNDECNIHTKTIDDLVEMRLGAVFMPHGLGHFIGLDTHDVGGYLDGHPPRIQQPGLCKLRTARVLQTNMVLTVEPGCYFIHHLLDEVMEVSHVLHPYINIDLINQEYRNFGGIRLEDVVQVTDDGIVNYTSCPRTIEEVENVCSRRMKWPPIHDMAPELRRSRLLDTKPLPSPPSM